MDREKPGVTKSQPGFVDFVVRPLFDTWVACFPDCKVSLLPCSSKPAQSAVLRHQTACSGQVAGERYCPAKLCPKLQASD